MKHRDGQKGEQDPVFAHLAPAPDDDMGTLVLGNISGEPEQGVEMISRTVLDASDPTSKPWEEKRRKYIIPTPSKDELKAGIDLLVKSLQSVAGTAELIVGLYLRFSDGKFCSSTAYQRLNPGNHEDTIDAQFTEGKRLKEFEIDLRTPEMHYRLHTRRTFLSTGQYIASGATFFIPTVIPFIKGEAQPLLSGDPLAYAILGGVGLASSLIAVGSFASTNHFDPVFSCKTTVGYSKPELEPWAEAASNAFSRKKNYEALEKMVQEKPHAL